MSISLFGACFHRGLLETVSRAVHLMFHESLGTTVLAAILPAIIYCFIQLRRLPRHATLKEWWLAVNEDYRSRKNTLYGTLLCWLILFSWGLWVASTEKPLFTPQQIHDYAYGTDIAITIAEPADSFGNVRTEQTNGIDIHAHFPAHTNSSQTKVRNTAFWINDMGYAATLFKTPSLETNNALGIGYPVVTAPQKQLGMTVETSLLEVEGDIKFWDNQTGLSFIYMPLNPFKLGPVSFEANGAAIAKQKYDLPCFSKVLPDIGDDIFIVVVEPEISVEGITIRTIPTKVEGFGRDFLFNKYFKRILTSVPFKGSYAGAPVFNASRELVGIMSTSGTVISSEYITEIMSRTGIDQHK